MEQRTSALRRGKDLVYSCKVDTQSDRCVMCDFKHFLLHILPDSFQRIRDYGFLGNRYREAKLALCRQLLGMVLTLATLAPPPQPDYRDLYEKLTGKSLRHCPVCHRGHMVVIAFNQTYGDPRSDEHRQDIIFQEGRSFRLKFTYRFNSVKRLGMHTTVAEPARDNLHSVQAPSGWLADLSS